MAYTVQEIATALDAEAFGAVDLLLTSASEPATAGASDLALAMSPAYAELLGKGQAQVAVVWPGCDWAALGLKAAIVAPRSRLAMAGLTQMLDTPFDIEDGIHPSALVEGAELGEDVAIGPFVHIAKGAKIGARTRIAGHVTIGSDVVIGEDCVILDGVRVMRRVQLGNRVVLHPNSVIGGDGFSWVTETPSNFELMGRTLGKVRLEPNENATQHRIHSLGGVIIHDDVEIGGLSTVDAGTIRATEIGRGCKLDNMVHIAHNAILGEDCVFAGKTAVAGSTVVGDRVMMGGRAGVKDNVTIGSDAIISASSVVLGDVPQGAIMMGHPARERHEEFQTMKDLRRLPRLKRELAELQKLVSKIGDSD